MKKPSTSRLGHIRPDDGLISTEFLLEGDDGRSRRETAAEILVAGNQHCQMWPGYHSHAESFVQLHQWAKGMTVRRGLRLETSSPERHLKPDGIPLLVFVAKDLLTGQTYYEVARITSPPNVDLFARRARRAIGANQVVRSLKAAR